ncbi:uncharacterized protein LACBIDRAFT_329841 [Laccaria bicolor S238N-H82]|uniref:Predicted protein n=1 Tax=Laccaria bicolor (strain S238N-H82 / ATCC MYA-4686) TaxID=486041 RepID=B0DJE7_LACBS|nr:uncharacterized protein LACBIDRAFT_329841 [Laccaria bicolor S238N-H82]EDR05508.1 predicted protein [Laccaria bicolor S238N-H82]|eukprot:XP_001884066.1 predicted protein [Laccaria bicolor S238N-H82]
MTIQRFLVSISIEEDPGVFLLGCTGYCPTPRTSTLLKRQPIRLGADMRGSHRSSKLLRGSWLGVALFRTIPREHETPSVYEIIGEGGTPLFYGPRQKSRSCSACDRRGLWSRHGRKCIGMERVWSQQLSCILYKIYAVLLSITIPSPSVSKVKFTLKLPRYLPDPQIRLSTQNSS